MKLSTRFRYGTRMLIDLGAHCINRPVFLKEIAERLRLSKKYLEQIAITLKTAGLIRTVRGAKGGYCLARDPRELYLIEVYNVLEGSTALIDCVDDAGTCPYDLVQMCPTRDTWDKLRIAIEKVLQSITLADLIQDYKEKKP